MTLLEEFVQNCVQEYQNFMGIEKMPEFEMCPIVVSQNAATQRGYGVISNQQYDINTGQHRLSVMDTLYMPQVHGEYVLFHEFTHMLDTEMYAKRDKMKNIAIKGFTEYHASQIDLLKLIGVQGVNDCISFSMLQDVETISGQKTVLEYVLDAHNAAVATLTRSNFPADLAAFVSALGLIFNYWGRLSICKMYATDYSVRINVLGDTNIEKQFLGAELYNLLDVFLDGWLDEAKIELLGSVYQKFVFERASQYSF